MGGIATSYAWSFVFTSHFFYSLTDWITEMADPRNQSYTTYTQADLEYMAILKNEFDLEVKNGVLYAVAGVHCGYVGALAKAKEK
ncbi:hypothetical protein SAMN02745243_00804 [Hespellia stercorisuis DSM 15480]|uniref:Uncharacterized protein n=2 Tax=Hespellia stercorisuis TaxID=180311 RepID=A0A1M6K0H1_9FIRM|nr:hypothetical protein SAMN02745243_00804 [Hespellia stercorisuis DSM 15480]